MDNIYLYFITKKNNMNNKTLVLLKRYALELNPLWWNLDDTDNFYDFCISSFLEDYILWEKEFNEVMISSFNMLWKITKKDTAKSFRMYNDYIYFLNYINKKWLIKTKNYDK